MFQVTVKMTFSGAHYLREYKGKCEQLHGHNWIVEATLGGDELGNDGLLFDFTLLKEKLTFILNELDHKLLNEHPYFANINPSAELIARYICEKLQEQVKIDGISVIRVRVHEGESSWADYIP